MIEVEFVVFMFWLFVDYLALTYYPEIGALILAAVVVHMFAYWSRRQKRT